jgi:hypothetical protein
MPYFVFRINNHREYRCLGQHETYRQARDDVRAKRRDQPASGVVDYRMIFASAEREAEFLLRTRRDKTPSEDG